MSWTRRKFLWLIAPVVAGAGWFTSQAAVGYRLRPTDKCRCRACKTHAANKLFGSEAAITRAHPGCRCAVEKVALSDALRAKLIRGHGHYDHRS